MLTPYAITQFGGLDLISAPDEGTGALQALDVDLDVPGAVRSRNAATVFKATALSGLNLFQYYSSSARYLLASNTATLKAYLFNGTEAFSTASTGPHSFARYGSPTVQQVFFANGLGGPGYFDTTGFHAGVYTIVTPSGKYIAVTPWDNRLVVANEATDVSVVRFSEPGDTSAFATNDYIDMAPGDGEEITGLAAWGNLLFVFKPSRFFVFYGTSTGPTGEPVFNYRAINTGGTGLVAPLGLAVAPEGVYFIARDGIYRTTGGPPVEVSRPIRPVWTAATTPAGALTYNAGRLYFADGRGALYVSDQADRYWLKWSLPAKALTVWSTAADNPELVYFMSGSPTTISYISLVETYPGGLYQTRYTDLGAATEKTVRDVSVWGTAETAGTMDVSLQVDYGQTHSDATVALGVAQASGRVGGKGTVFSVRLHGNTDFVVHRIGFNVLPPASPAEVRSR